MRKRVFERLVESLGELSPAQLRLVSQRVGELNDRREIQDLMDKRVQALGACPNLPVYLAWFRFFDRTAGAARPQHLFLDAIGVPHPQE